MTPRTLVSLLFFGTLTLSGCDSITEAFATEYQVRLEAACEDTCRLSWNDGDDSHSGSLGNGNSWVRSFEAYSGDLVRLEVERLSGDGEFSGDLYVDGVRTTWSLRFGPNVPEIITLEHRLPDE